MLITLKNNGYSAKIETIGAELKSFSDPQGKEYLWNSDPTYWEGCSPLLFPTIGNLRNDSTIINGVAYPMPKHGFCRKAEFKIIEQLKNRVVFSFQDNAETKLVFPFTFEIRLTYELNNSKISIVYDVVNMDSIEMYYHLGAHPAFNCPMEEGEVFSDYIIRFEHEETCDSHVYDIENRCFSVTNTVQHLNNSNYISLDYDKFLNDALVFEHLKSRSIQIINPKTEKGVQVDYPDFVTIAFWTIPEKNAPYICVEPWNGAAIYADEDNIFKNKRDIQTLQPNEKKSYHLSISIIN